MKKLAVIFSLLTVILVINLCNFKCVLCALEFFESDMPIYSIYDENFNLLFERDEVEIGDSYMSNDYKYTFLERMGGLSSKQIDSVFGDINKLTNKSIDDINVNDVKGFISQYKKLAEQAGLESVDWDALDKQADVYLQQIKDYEKEIKSAKIGAGIGGAAIALLVIGLAAATIATGGGAMAVLGAAGTAAGAGGFTSAIMNSVDAIEALEDNKKAQEDLLKKEYLNSLVTMVNEVNAKKREQQIREYQSQR